MAEVIATKKHKGHEFIFARQFDPVSNLPHVSVYYKANNGNRPLYLGNGKTVAAAFKVAKKEFYAPNFMRY